MNCLPFLGHRKWEVSFMSEDLRFRHDADARREAARLFAMGYGYGPVASMMSLPEEAVRKWLYTFRAVGLEGLLNMGKTQAKYSWELKCAAAKAVVEDGMPVVEAMAAYGVASRSPLNKWCKLYREGGAEALRPKPKGRPGGSGGKPKQLTREQELERRIQRLEAENAYLKKSIALRAEKRSRTARKPRP